MGAGRKIKINKTKSYFFEDEQKCQVLYTHTPLQKSEMKMEKLLLNLENYEGSQKNTVNNHMPKNWIT